MKKIIKTLFFALCLVVMVSCGSKGGEDVEAKAKAYVQKIEAAEMRGDYDTVERLSREAENWLMGLCESDQEKVFNALMEEVDSYEYSVPDSSAYGYDDYSYGGGYDYGDDYDDCNYNDADDYSYDSDEDYEDYEGYDDFEW